MPRGLYDRNQRYWQNAKSTNEKNRENFEDNYKKYTDQESQKGKFHISSFAKTIFWFIIVIAFIVLGIRYFA